MTTTHIGNDILDIGSRKARRQREAAVSLRQLTAAGSGSPGQFDIPNVSDVRFRFSIIIVMTFSVSIGSFLVNSFVETYGIVHYDFSCVKPTT